MSLLYAVGLFLAFGVVSAFLTWVLIRSDNENFYDGDK